MSNEEERSVPPDLFSAQPAFPRTAASTAAAAGAFAPPVRAYARPPVPPKRSGPLRRVLPWVAVVWGSFSLILFIGQAFAFSGYSGNGYYHGGQFLGFAFAVALVVTGMQEISSHHIRRSRALPWLMGFLAVTVAIAIAIPLLLPRHYPTSIRTGFLDSCQSHGGSAARCGCALNWFESNESLSEYLAVDADIRAGNPMPGDIAAAIASSCTR